MLYQRSISSKAYSSLTFMHIGKCRIFFDSDQKKEWNFKAPLVFVFIAILSSQRNINEFQCHL